MSVHYDLESRYRRLLRFYPRQYRAERGDEIVDIYMEMTSSDRAKPSLTDVADIAKAGIRQRFRDMPTGFDHGLRIAAIVAMCAVAVLGADGSLSTAMVVVGMENDGYLVWNAFVTVGVAIEALWVVTGIVAPFLPARITRLALGATLAVTLAVTFLPLFTNAITPDPLWLPGVILCGIVALTWPDNPRWWMRALPSAAVVTTFAATAGSTYLPWHLQMYFLTGFIPAELFLLVAAVLSLRAIVRRDAAARMWWALAILATPAAFVAWRPMIEVLHFNRLVPPNALLPLSITLLIGHRRPGGKLRDRQPQATLLMPQRHPHGRRRPPWAAPLSLWPKLLILQ